MIGLPVGFGFPRAKPGEAPSGLQRPSLRAAGPSGDLRRRIRRPGRPQRPLQLLGRRLPAGDLLDELRQGEHALFRGQARERQQMERRVRHDRDGIPRASVTLYRSGMSERRTSASLEATASIMVLGWLLMRFVAAILLQLCIVSCAHSTGTSETVASQPIRPRTLREYFRDESFQAERWAAACYGSASRQCSDLRRSLAETHDLVIEQVGRACSTWIGAGLGDVAKYAGTPDDDDTSLVELGARAWQWNWSHILGASAFSVMWKKDGDAWRFGECRLCESSHGVGGCHRLPIE